MIELVIEIVIELSDSNLTPSQLWYRANFNTGSTQLCAWYARDNASIYIFVCVCEHM